MLRNSSATASMAIQPSTTGAGRRTQQAATRAACAAAASKSKARRGQFGRSTIAISPATAGVNNKAQIMRSNPSRPKADRCRCDRTRG